MVRKMIKIKPENLTMRDIALLELLIFRLKQEGVIGHTYEVSDFVDIILKRGEYAQKEVK